MLSNKSSKIIYEITPGSKPLSAGYQIDFTFFSMDQIKIYVTDGITQSLLDDKLYTIIKSETIYKVVFADDYVFPSSAIKMIIVRDVVFQQQTNLLNGELIDAEVLELALDQIVAMNQQLKELTDRAILSPISESSQMIIPERQERAEHLLAFDEKGNPYPVLTSDIAQNLAEALLVEKKVIESLDLALSYAQRAETASEETYNNRFMTELAKTQALSASLSAKDNADNARINKIESDRILALINDLKDAAQSILEQVNQISIKVNSNKEEVSENLNASLIAKNNAIQASMNAQDAKSQAEAINIATNVIFENVNKLSDQIASITASVLPATTIVINGVLYNVSFYTKGLRTYRKLEKVVTA